MENLVLGRDWSFHHRFRSLGLQNHTQTDISRTSWHFPVTVSDNAVCVTFPLFCCVRPFPHWCRKMTVQTDRRWCNSLSLLLLLLLLCLLISLWVVDLRATVVGCAWRRLLLLLRSPEQRLRDGRRLVILRRTLCDKRCFGTKRLPQESMETRAFICVQAAQPSIPEWPHDQCIILKGELYF